MLDAGLRDLGQCPRVRTVTLLDTRGPRPSADWLNHATIRVAPGQEQGPFFACAGRADFTLVIAPEFDNLLSERCEWVEEAGGRLLGPAVEGVRLTADKLRLANHLRRGAVPTPATFPWSWADGISPLPLPFPLVCKPRFGAGSQATFLWRNADEIAVARLQAEMEGWHDQLIVQPYAEGMAASVAFLIGRGSLVALPAATQHLSSDGRFRYLGGSLPLSATLNARGRTFYLPGQPGFGGWHAGC